MCDRRNFSPRAAFLLRRSESVGPTTGAVRPRRSEVLSLPPRSPRRPRRSPSRSPPGRGTSVPPPGRPRRSGRESSPPRSGRPERRSSGSRPPGRPRRSRRRSARRRRRRTPPGRRRSPPSRSSGRREPPGRKSRKRPGSRSPLSPGFGRPGRRTESPGSARREARTISPLAGSLDVPGIAIPTTEDGATIVPDIERAAFLLYVGFSLEVVRPSGRYRDFRA